MIQLELKGHVPSKASLYRKGRNGLFIRNEAAAQISALGFQLNGQWNRRSQIMHPDVTVRLYVANDAQDRDGCLKTVLDLLQQSGVIWNDNIKHFNGWLRIAPAVVTRDEKVLIEIKEATDGSKQRSA